MTTTTDSIEITYTDGAPLAVDDPRLPLARTAQLAHALAARVDETNAALTTPCPDWDVAALTRHVVGVFRRVAAAPTGADLNAMSVVPDIDVTDLGAALDDATASVHAAWSDPSRLEQLIEAPWGPTPGAVCLLIWASDVAVHCWDLAVALGIDVNWPDDIAVLDGVMRGGLPAEGRDEIPFGEVVEVAEDASPIDRLVAWVGRDPALAPR
ncbi:MAG: TIGR03086 family metal-binding protein [Actinomycetota bacterium]